MRSITVFLISGILDDPYIYLSQNYPSQANPWVDNSNDPILYIDITKFNEWDNILGGTPLSEYELQERQDLIAILGRKPTHGVTINVSGRHKGDQEVQKCINALLSRFVGVAQDEYTSHFWTLTEIQSGTRIEGHLFFDYQGWYDERLTNSQEREKQTAIHNQLIQEQFGNATDDETLGKMIVAGYMIDAVVRLRKRTGWSLKTAVDYIREIKRPES
jgi:hypothetical protein